MRLLTLYNWAKFWIYFFYKSNEILLLLFLFQTEEHHWHWFIVPKLGLGGRHSLFLFDKPIWMIAWKAALIETDPKTDDKSFSVISTSCEKCHPGCSSCSGDDCYAYEECNENHELKDENCLSLNLDECIPFIVREKYRTIN